MISYMDGLKAQLQNNAPMDWKDIAALELRRFNSSDKLKWMKLGQKYYRVANDVLHRERFMIDENGRMLPAKNVADNRLAHGFLRELTDQKIQYLLGRPFSIQAQEDCLRAITPYFDKAFANTLKRAAKDAVCQGLGWLHPHYDEEGRLRFYRMAPDEMIPMWRDEAHTKLDAMIRVYSTEEYAAKENKSIEKVEVWTNDGVLRFIRNAGALHPDMPHYLPHVPARGGDETHIGYNWGRIPFIAVKYNDDEIPLIQIIKSLVDDYDRVASDDSNALEDQPNSILVVRNYDGQKLGDFRKNLAAYRAVKVTDDGGVTALNTPLNTVAANAHLDRLRRDIYAFGRGVDFRGERLGNAASGIALKQEYAGLDLDCNALETEIHYSLESLLWFVFNDIKRLTDDDFSRELVDFIFNRDIVIHEEAAIAMCRDSMHLISAETVIANHPWVRDVNAELLRIKLESEKGGSNE